MGRGRKMQIDQSDSVSSELTPADSSSNDDFSNSQDFLNSTNDEEDDSSCGGGGEPEDEHVPGGYANIEMGQTIGHYNIDRQLGWGHFSTVFQATRIPRTSARQNTGTKQVEVDGDSQPVFAIKVAKSKPSYASMAKEEIEIYRKIRRISPRQHPNLIYMVENFTYKDVNGLHHCLVFDCQGPNLFDILQEQCLDFAIVQRLSQQLFKALDFLHTKCQMLHTDLKPENLLLSYDSKPSDPMEWSLRLADLGNVDTPKHSRTSYSTAQTREYRAPEVIFRHGYSYPVDIWSAACVIFELATGNLLFKPYKSDNDTYKSSEKHVSLMIRLIGMPPKPFLKRNVNTSLKFFKRGAYVMTKLKKGIEDIEHKLINAHEWEVGDAKTLSTFLHKLLRWIPEERLTAQQILKDSFLRA